MYIYISTYLIFFNSPILQSINKNDFSSVKFEKEIKNIVQYSTLEGYAKNKTADDEINNWI